jgi:hypothetical protein
MEPITLEWKDEPHRTLGRLGTIILVSIVSGLGPIGRAGYSLHFTLPGMENRTLTDDDVTMVAARMFAETKINNWFAYCHLTANTLAVNGQPEQEEIDRTDGQPARVLRLVNEGDPQNTAAGWAFSNEHGSTALATCNNGAWSLTIRPTYPPRPGKPLELVDITDEAVRELYELLRTRFEDRT